MSRKSKSLVFDAWSILAYLKDEPAGEQVENLIADAHESGASLAMSIVNLAEVWYNIARLSDEKRGDQAVTEVRQLGIELVEVDWDLAHAAAAFKARHKMSLADCFAAALAKARKAELVTGDAEFKQVESQVSVRWL